VNRDLGAVVEITGKLSVNSEPESVALAVLNPVAHFLRHLRRALKAKGINEHADISRYTQITDVLSPFRSVVHELAVVESPPLSQLLVETNQNSNNLTRGVAADAGSVGEATGTC